MNTKNPTLANSSTARKVVGSLGVIGAAAAVAGMGTFGTFTDSSTPVATTISSGTLSIDATHQDTLPLSVAGFVPGDSMTRFINLTNDGTTALGSVTLATTAAAPSVLITDAANGLQLSVKSCTVAWTADGACTGTVTDVRNGPAIGQVTLANPASLAAGGTDHLAYTVSLPTTADNTFQGQSAQISLTFTGTQRTGTTR